MKHAEESNKIKDKCCLIIEFIIYSLPLKYLLSLVHWMKTTEENMEIVFYIFFNRLAFEPISKLCIHPIYKSISYIFFFKWS